MMNTRRDEVVLLLARSAHKELNEKEIKIKLSGNEFHYTACSSPVIFRNSCCQRVLIRFIFRIRASPLLLLTGDAFPRKCAGNV